MRNSKRAVILKNTGEIFPSVSKAGKKYGIIDSNISKCCKGIIATAGKLDGESLVWRYYDEYHAEEITPPNGGKRDQRKIPVVLMNTSEFFDSVVAASKKSGVDKSSILKCCKGQLKSAGRDRSGTKLIWAFRDDV